MSDGFSLRALVREVLGTTDALGPAAVAAEVLDRLPAADREAALVQGVTEVAREVIARSRVAPVEPVSAPEHVRPAGSSKVSGIRASFRALHNQIAVGGGQRKRLRDCTFDDLVHAAEVCERMAAANAHRAGQYRALGDLVQSSGAATVGDLSDHQIGSALDDAA